MLSIFDTISLSLTFTRLLKRSLEYFNDFEGPQDLKEQ